MATFSKRHYKSVAEILKRMKPIIKTKNDSCVEYYDFTAMLSQWEVTCDVFCREFAADNSAFKPDKFLTDCGVK